MNTYILQYFLHSEELTTRYKLTFISEITNFGIHESYKYLFFTLNSLIIDVLSTGSLMTKQPYDDKGGGGIRHDPKRGGVLGRGITRKRGLKI